MCVVHSDGSLGGSHYEMCIVFKKGGFLIYYFESSSRTSTVPQLPRGINAVMGVSLKLKWEKEM